MKAAKRIMATLLALAMAAGVSACGKKDAGSDSASSALPGKDLNDDQKEIIDALAPQLPDRNLENTTITWMAHYDINPTNGKVKAPALQLFETKYGGTIEYNATTWNTRYTDLASAILGGNSPDFFPADDMDAFPRGAVRNMFQPIDDYVDLDSDLWAPSKVACDAFLFRGSHYIAVIETQPNIVCVYNRTTIEDNGYDDPAELFAKGEWTWDTFAEMCRDFTDADADKYGLDGWYYSQGLSETCGVPIIGLEDGVVVNNMADPAIENVQAWMYDLQKDGVMYPMSENGWAPRGGGDPQGEGVGTNLTLFYPIGLWGIEGAPETTAPFGDMAAGEVMFVPMPISSNFNNPQDPDYIDPEEDFDAYYAKYLDNYYISSRISGYNICVGAPNPEGVAAYLDCVQIATQSKDVQQISDDILLDEYLWTQEMVDMRHTSCEMAAAHPVFDFSSGVDPDMYTTMNNNVKTGTMKTGGNAQTWAEIRESYQGEIDWYIDNFNNTAIADNPEGF